MTIIRTSLGTVESARRVRFEPGGSVAATDVQKAIEEVAGDAAAALTASIRERLVADRSYHVNPSIGADSNSGLSPSTPFATIQKAVDVVIGTLDINNRNVTINLAAGTYTAGAAIVSAPLGLGTGAFRIIGDTTTPANCHVNVSSGDCFVVNGAGSKVRIAGIKMSAAAGAGARISDGAAFMIDGICEFGACGQFHMRAARSCSITLLSGYIVSGSTGSHFSLTSACFVTAAASAPVSITANISCLWVSADTLGAFLIGSSAMTFNLGSFAVTGSRYASTNNAVINTSGSGPNYFPGTTAGSTSNGGLYL